MNPTGRPPGLPSSPEPSSPDPFVPDLSEGAETGVYLALLELLDEGLIITGDEVILDANSAACRLLQRDYRQVAGRPLTELFPSEEAFLAARARVLIQGEKRGTLSFALPGGELCSLDFVAAPRLRPGIHAIILSAPGARPAAQAGTALAATSPAAPTAPARTGPAAPARGSARARRLPRPEAEPAQDDKADMRAMYLACHDLLTGLPNRRLLEARFDDGVARALAQRTSMGVLRIDIDGFKAVNRAHGDTVGDAALQHLAHRLNQAGGSRALVARERSDSFLVLLPELDLPGDAGRVADALLAAVAQPLALGAHSLQLTASAGIALFPQDGRELDTLLRHARTALGQAQRLGGNNHQFFNGLADSLGFDMAYLENDLRQALEADELLLHFQPLIDARSGQVCAGEALLRWQHPELGLLPFRRFIGAVSDPTLLARVGDWVLAAACRLARQWPATASGSTPRLTVNVGIEQLIHGDFAERVAASLRSSGLPPQRLELDLDEKVMAEDGSNLAETLRRLAEIGVRLAVDDFGRGLSSIPRLRRYPLKAIKLDPALVRGVGRSEDSEAVVEAISGLAATLGLEVYARGVEEPGQQAFLCALDCQLQQGPLFGRPMPACEFEAFLAASAQ
ncbi:EAL domain-containing protein [Thauera sp.]|uniref:putative bifunctional diguanylate cyclase/phosphodiesterase n=1 Tax=Thauera sp. TaxID=1905334 RepID=UPI002B7D4220|nr:EAL domain-containing protein [Thauera sp.]HRP25190.1 EAL domain-containing protein [Thauera sp.]